MNTDGKTTKRTGGTPPVRAREVPASFIVEELTDSENLIRFSSFQQWLEGDQPFMVEGRIEHSLAINDVLPVRFGIERTVTGQRAVAAIATSGDMTIGMEAGQRYTEFRVSATTQLHELMGLARPDRRSPRLVLWHGEPGTGKTTALRSLAREWEPWASLHYVSDPEKFFDGGEYLNDVLDEPVGEPNGPTLESPARPNGTWRLVAAEDADEFLKANARDRAGAALGRVLNLSDGILGQHHNVILLLTTNEEVGRLHPALVRPGRCLSRIEFTRFPVDEARAWLGDGFGRVGSRMTLAELLAKRGDISGGSTPEESSPSIGAYL